MRRWRSFSAACSICFTEAAKYSRPLLSYSDRACVGRNNLATDTDKHAEHITAIGSSLLPGACFLRQAVPGRCVYRISVEVGAVKISNQLASLYRNCPHPLWYAGRLLPCALFRWHSGMLLLQFLFVRFTGQLLYTRLLYFADIQSAADSNYVGARLWYLHKRWSRLLQLFVPGRCGAGTDACHRLQAAVCTAHACRQKPMHRLWFVRKEVPDGIR